MSARIQFDAADVYHQYFELLATADTIADQYGCSNVTVLNFIRRSGWVVRDNSTSQRTTRYDAYSPKAITKYRKLYEAGCTFMDISKRFRLDHRRLSAIAKSEGWFIPRGVWLSKLAKKRAKETRLRRLAKFGCSNLTPNDYRSLVNTLSTAVLAFYSVPGKRRMGTGLTHLDHIYPMVRAYYGLDGGKTPCSVFELCHPANLRFLPARENLRKGASLELSLSALRANIRRYNKEWGNPWHVVEKLRRFRQAVGQKDRSAKTRPSLRIRKS